MHTAYLIAAHHQPAHLGRLVRALDAPGIAFFIHIDAKVDEAAFRAAIGLRTNVAFVRERVWITHSGFSQVRATLALLSEALEADPDIWRFCLLSGSDFPIKPNADIRRAFSSAQQFISVGRKLDAQMHCPHRKYVRYRWFVDTPRPARQILSGWFPHSRPPLDIYHGSSWWALTRDCVEYVRDVLRGRDDIAAYFKFTLCPDELFFQSILIASPFATHIAPKSGPRVAGCHYIDWRPRSDRGPKVMGLEDHGALLGSPALFARKFDEKRSAVLLSALEQGVLAAEPLGGRAKLVAA